MLHIGQYLFGCYMSVKDIHVGQPICQISTKGSLTLPKCMSIGAHNITDCKILIEKWSWLLSIRKWCTWAATVHERERARCCPRCARRGVAPPSRQMRKKSSSWKLL